ncbi:biopolymer transporter ExbB [Alphaproteobacteria bacterium KMM 3653]|uniref:Biopolymer transporter ExbB n=1 Tax=Harenicola maris TaxID=2841044 RepID=A0AAP2CK17_9RHOB|nr:biopolymer transporter ExbB [Harenicola maris]
MDMTRPEAEPQFSQPVRQITLMLLVLLLVGVGGYLVYPTVQGVIVSNPFLNGVIGVVFVFGVLATFWQVWQLITSVNWVEGFTLGEKQGEAAPRLLASLAALLRSRGARTQINTASAQSILDSVATRIEELRDITRYIVNLLVFLGLLGTFYGLATTVPAVVETIRSLAPQDGEGSTEIFGRLMGGLEAQLGGMGTAFGSSLLGLAGSLVVGLLELFVSHGQNRFYRELEEWVSSITKTGFSSGDAEGFGDGGAVAGILDHMAEQMEGMRQMFTQSDINRAMLEDKMSDVASAVQDLAVQIGQERRGSGALDRLASSQERLLEHFEAAATREGGGDDAEARMRLRSIDTQLLHILEEMAAGRQEAIGDLRSDMAVLIKSVREASRAERRREP